MNRFVLMCSLVLVALCVDASAEHPSVLVRPQDRASVAAKLQNAPWAKASFEALKSETDRYIELCRSDPKYFSSRLFLHWNTRYITPVVKDSRWSGGEGQADRPTARFAGARDWTTKYSAPSKLEDLHPFNENEPGQIWLLNKETGKPEWANAGETGRIIEITNARLIQAASDAAFIYWVTGDEKYATFASEILWTYMDAFSLVTAPKLPPGDQSMVPIIGMTSFEVIHEDIVTYIGISYDFLYEYLRAHGKDVDVIQVGLKRMLDRVIEGGNREGNWNLHQARIIAYGGLPLESNDAYQDGKGREYYVDVVLNADLPHQLGIARVIHATLDEDTALWPEAPGYGFGAVGDVIHIASLAASAPAAKRTLADPLLAKAARSAAELTYPNGWSIGLGDTSNTRVNALALELLIADARKRGEANLEQSLTALLQREIDSGAYNRSRTVNLFALTHYVDELAKTDALPSPQRSFYCKALNVFMQRSRADDVEHALSAAMYGTSGGHVHVNGLAMELFGAGLILGADPGRGSSYWQKDHTEYYLQPPAHNTVIVNGKSRYSPNGSGQLAMKIDACDPKPGEDGTDPDISFTQASFAYKEPAATQQRTLALVKLSATCGFYFDVFRSKVQSNDGEFHDYLYHNIGQSVSLSDEQGEPLNLTTSAELSSAKGLLKGYDYFSHERSLETASPFHATFVADVKGKKHLMNLWMTGSAGRRVFAVDAPPNRAIREALPPSYSTMPMPTIVVRNQGDAWRSPFVAVYEPCLGTETAAVRSIRTIPTPVSTAVLCEVTGFLDEQVKQPFVAYLYQSDQPDTQCTVDGRTFHGRLGIVLVQNGVVVRSYFAD